MLQNEFDILDVLDAPPQHPNPSPKPESRLWQHMPVEFFLVLLKKRELFLKCVRDCKEDIERDAFDAYDHIQFENDDQRSIAQNALKGTRNITFISCWYNAPFLSKSVFSEFTAGNNGVAICTTYQKLYDLLEPCENSINDKLHFWCGAVQYLDNQRAKLGRTAWEKNNDGFSLNTIAPYFLKRTDCHHEREFRVVCRTPLVLSKNAYTISFTSPYNPTLPIDIPCFIDTIAISAQKPPAYTELVMAICDKYKYTMEQKEDEMECSDGFILYTLRKRSDHS